MMPRRSQTEITAICEKAHVRITAGEMATNVCKELGCVGVYYKWRRKILGAVGKRRVKARSKALVPITPVHHVFPLQPEKPVAGNDYLTIKGSPEAVARFVREFGRGNNG